MQAATMPVSARISQPPFRAPGDSYVRAATSPRPEDLDERVATREDYPSLKAIIPLLRNAGDPNPAMVAPHKTTNLQYGHHCDCLTNTARYLAQHPDATPVKCFRLWISPVAMPGGGLCVSAQMHLIPLHDGKYVEVTPPEMGDDGKVFMIVPTSRAYPDFSAEQLCDMHHNKHYRLRLGGVFFPPSYLEFQQSLRGPERAQGDAKDLVVYACPYIYDLPSYVPRDVLREQAEDLDERNRLLYRLDALLALVDANRWDAQDKSEATHAQGERHECAYTRGRAVPIQ